MNDFEKENQAPAFRASVETQAIIKRLESAAPGETVTWEELTALTKCADHVRLNSYVTTARKTVKRESRIVFGSRPGVGYQRLDDAGIVDAGRADRQKLGRAVKRSMETVACADPDHLTPVQRNELAKVQTQLGVMRVAASLQTTKKLEQRLIDHKPVEAGDIMRLFG